MAEYCFPWALDSMYLNDGDKFAIDQLGDGTIILKKVGERSPFGKWLNEGTFKGSDNSEH